MHTWTKGIKRVAVARPRRWRPADRSESIGYCPRRPKGAKHVWAKCGVRRLNQKLSEPRHTMFDSLHEVTRQQWAAPDLVCLEAGESPVSAAADVNSRDFGYAMPLVLELAPISLLGKVCAPGRQADLVPPTEQASEVPHIL